MLDTKELVDELLLTLKEDEESRVEEESTLLDIDELVDELLESLEDELLTTPSS